MTSGFGANRGMILPHPDKVSHFTNGVQFGSSEGTNLVAGHVDDGDRTHGALWALHQMKLEHRSMSVTTPERCSPITQRA